MFSRKNSSKIPRAQCCTLLSAMLIIFCALRVPAHANEPKEILFRQITAIDGVNGRRENVDVLVQGNQIVSITKSAPTARSNGHIIDGRGKFLIPGLWDAHVHLTFDKTVDYRTFFPLAMAFGVTSLRDTGAQIDDIVRVGKHANTDQTPNLYYSGPLLDGARRVYDGSSASVPEIAIAAPTVEDAERAVDDLFLKGAQFIKAYEMLAPEVYRAVVSRAHAHSLPVAAHVPLSMRTTDVVETGVRDLQHLRNLEFACSENPEALLKERTALLATLKAPSASRLRSSLHRIQRKKALSSLSARNCKALIEALAATQIIQTPTLTVTSFWSRRLYAEESWKNTFKLLPMDTQKKWFQGAERLSSLPENREGVSYYDWITDTVVQMSKAGVPIMAGTDAPLSYLTPGLSLHEELAMLVDIGLEPIDAIKAATYVPATFFNFEHKMGSVAAGMAADLVVLNADPTENIRNTTRIHAVVKNGNLLNRARLDELLAAAQAPKVVLPKQ